MKRRVAIPYLCVLLLITATGQAADDPPIPPTVAVGAGLIEVYSSDAFHEGPTWDPATGKLYFTAFFSGDEKYEQILRLDAPGKATVWADRTKGVNGTCLSNNGRLLGAQAFGHHVLSYGIGPDGPTDVKSLYFDESLNQPNDVCQTPNGNIYFSDPDFKNHKTSAVYLLTPDGKARKILDDMPVPNGVIASNDGRTLYVGDSHLKLWRSYPIQKDGSVGEGKVFFDPDTDNLASPDGMTIDEHGNLYFSGRGGVWVASPEGKSLGAILIPEFCSNVTFGGADGRTLYMTCSKKVYSLEMKVRGGQFKNLPLPEDESEKLGEIPRLGPMSPEEALNSFQTLDGFRMELLASEPKVADPVDMAYDENGRAYVVEMRGYPYPEAAGAVPLKRLGKVRILDDANGDGVFDESHVFVDGLFWPTSVAIWKGGVYVTAAPDIWYFKDTDGDNKADIKQKVYTGFGRANVQAIVNNLKWGLDHRIYGAASGNGGRIVPADDPQAKPIVLRRADFRFDPVDGAFEAISGGARFGNSFDDWGNRFLCNIRNPAQHVVLPAHYLRRNRYLSVPGVIHDVAQSGETVPVYRISPVEPWRELRARRWAAERVNYPRSELVGAGFFTSSSGVTIYRGAAYPRKYYGNVFVSDVAGNLIHRESLQPTGVTFEGIRSEKKAEFVASTDTWFRPVNYVNAPDGTLHVLDMYRETIEHPWSIPDDIKARVDLESGNDRGRIYRLAPPNFQPTKPPRLGDATTAELVATLENPNSWWRETAHRLIYERQDSAAVEPLRALLRMSDFPQARLHAMWSLAGLDALTDGDLQIALKDAAPGVREHAVRLAEPRLLQSSELRSLVFALADDAHPRVRFQVAFTLGEVNGPEATAALARIARCDAGDHWTRTAVLSSAEPRADALLKELLSPGEAGDEKGRTVLVRELAMIVGARGKDDELARALEAAAALTSDGKRLDLQYSLLAGLGDGLKRRRTNLGEYLASSPLPAAKQVSGLLDEALETIVDADAPILGRVQAIELVRHDTFDRTRDALTSVLGPQHPPEVQRTAARVLASHAQDEVATILLANWRAFTPPVRTEVIQLLLTRSNWIEPFLTAMESGRIQPSQVPTNRRALLMRNRNESIRTRAEKLFGPEAPGARTEILAQYEPALRLDSDAARGRIVYKRECMTCHRVGREGHDVGPDLSTIRHRSPEEILIHILDPNREVSPNYIDYVVSLKDGRVLTGTIAAEAGNSLTLKRAEGAQDTILREDIEEIASTGKSIMPEGLEKKITQQEMADLIAFLLRLE